jgi:AP-2 complex subunit beta-1
MRILRLCVRNFLHLLVEPHMKGLIHPVTLLSKPPELQFVALRNAQLILEKRPEILRNDIKVFFCKYNDPIYVKLAKLEVIVKLASENNIDKVLEELKE